MTWPGITASPQHWALTGHSRRRISDLKSCATYPRRRSRIPPLAPPRSASDHRHRLVAGLLHDGPLGGAGLGRGCGEACPKAVAAALFREIGPGGESRRPLYRCPSAPERRAGRASRLPVKAWAKAAGLDPARYARSGPCKTGSRQPAFRPAPGIKTQPAHGAGKSAFYTAATPPCATSAWEPV
jgi:hypothetical protein